MSRTRSRRSWLAVGAALVNAAGAVAVAVGLWLPWRPDGSIWRHATLTPMLVLSCGTVMTLALLNNQRHVTGPAPRSWPLVAAFLAACAAWLSYAEYEDIAATDRGIGGTVTLVGCAALVVGWVVSAVNRRGWNVSGRWNDTTG